MLSWSADTVILPRCPAPAHCGTERTTPGSRPCPSVSGPPSGHLLSQRHLGISPQALPESCASPMSDQVFRSPRPDLFQRWTHAEPSPGSRTVPSPQEHPQDGPGVRTAVLWRFPQDLVPSERPPPACPSPGFLRASQHSEEMTPSPFPHL